MVNRILLVEDDKSIRFGVARHLENRGFVVAEAVSCESARERFRTFNPDAVIADFCLPDGDGTDLIRQFRREKPALPIVILTGYGSIELAVRAVKSGADNLLTKPIDLDRLVEELHRACRAALPPPTDSSTERRPLPTPFALKEDIERLKDLECSLLILGETGTGKTKLARWLHQGSKRREKQFVDLNCAGLARDLVESELFGHERGAFTSAHAAKPGMFELADGGTLFLDEIGDIDLAVQPKVLKAIEEKRFRRMGSGRERTVDVRIIAATHRDLREASRTEHFRSDLYYRLSTVTITIPALRERRAEIPTLAEELVGSLAQKIGRNVPELAPDALELLKSHPWPGNVRELKNVLERALHFAPGETLFAHDLHVDASPSSEEVTGQTSTLRALERSHIERALATHGGNVVDAARSLGISRSALYVRLKTYGLLPARGSSTRIKVGAGGA